MPGQVLDHILSAKRDGRKCFGVLIDPEASNLVHLDQIAKLSEQAAIDFFLIGGSLLMEEALDESLNRLREVTDLPLVLFPGDQMQVSSKADAILLLSLISGRNPQMLIGQHVSAAPRIKRSGLEVIPTGYMLIDGGRPTSVQYMSGTMPIPGDKPDIAACTALAGEQLGLKVTYMDAGSGAQDQVSDEMLSTVALATTNPIMCGGGIRTAESVFRKGRAGADVVIVGNAIEKDPSLIMEMTIALQESL